MKIKKIKIENYRLLKNISIDLEDELSLVIGKNNTGKTSLLLVMEKFLNPSDRNKISFDDFNLDFKEKITKLIESDDLEEAKYHPHGIKLKLFIEYNDTDDLSNVSNVMMDLDPDNKMIVLGFEYILDFDELKRLKDDYKDYKEKKDKAGSDERVKKLDYYFENNYSKYFKTFKKSIKYDKESNAENELIYINLEKENISLKDIINFKYISAKRDVANKEMDKTLSSQTSKIYQKTEASNEQEAAIDEFKDRLVDTDISLSGIYAGLFKDIVNKVKTFGGIKKDDSVLQIVSTLQHKELLSGNTTVIYEHSGHTLPEHYNGLGYMNLISIIFEIELLLKDFKKTKDKKPSDVNLLFIEEPEAHTHPQMQHVFINNIKNLLKESLVREDGKKIELQYIISTHSSHIVSESDFDDIKYLRKESNNSVISKNLKSLEKEYKSNGEEENYRFLKQYLTLNRAELFFADKAILIEGDTERIILPAMMKKIDQENTENPLLSQYISIVEVGAYSQIFEKFINFVGTKTLLITDIDSGTKEKIACRVSASDASITTNTALKYFFGSDDINIYKSKTIKEKALSKGQDDQKWVVDEDANILLVYQTEETNSDGEVYHARSFEDSFFHINKRYILDEKNKFSSLVNKWLKEFQDKKIDVYEFAERAVGSKPSLAIEILLNSKADEQKKEFSNWEIPNYIKEGLEWLQKD